jgi:precorrin-4/cobalt-precorrin-4 C11-methyltransferase
MKTELTAPEVSQIIVLTRTAGRTPMPTGQDLAQMARTQATLCIFLSVHAMAEVAGTLAAQYGADCPAAVVYHASWPDERVIRGTLEDIAGKVATAGIGKTAMIIVGRALERHGTVSRLYSGQFAHGYREARKS